MTAFPTSVCVELAASYEGLVLRFLAGGAPPDINSPVQDPINASSAILTLMHAVGMRLSDIFLVRLPAVVIAAVLLLWPNVLNWWQEGRFTAELDASELRADRSTVAESWRARGMVPQNDSDALRTGEETSLRRHQAGYGTVRTADGALLFA